MMTFGWRPRMSCYQPPVTAASSGLNTGQIAPVAQNTTQQSIPTSGSIPASGTPLMAQAMGIDLSSGACPNVTWWYSLMAVAAIWGYSQRRAV